MKNTFFHLKSFLPVFAAVLLPLAARAAEPEIVPAVQRWTDGNGTLTLTMPYVIEVASKDKSALGAVATQLQGELAAMGLGAASLKFADKPSAGAIFLSLAKPASPVPHADEAYALSLDRAARITAETETGIFYGTRSLLQLLREHADGKLPRGEIVDFPQYARRMLMLDVGRKPFPIEVLHDYLKIMSWYKLNELHLHLSDEAFGDGYSGFRVQCDTFPGLTSKDVFYTKQQLRALQDDAKARGIIITPEIDMPGHALCFTTYWPDLRHPKLGKAFLDVTNPNTIERMKKLLDEMIPIFDAPDFHIGTDEYRMGGVPKAEQEKLGEAFRQFINTMNAHIRAKGKNCRIWSGYEYMPGTTLPDPSVTIDMWVTRDAKTLIEQGHNVINSSDGLTYLCPGCHYYGVNNAGIYNNWEPWKISSDVSKNPEPNDPHLLGGKLHLWGDQAPTGWTMTEIVNLVLPSLQAFSEKLWGTKGSKDYPEFQKRTALTLPVPGVTVFDRIPAKNADGVVLDLSREFTLGATNVVVKLPFAGKSRADLEWPWTLTMQVCQTAETGRRGVILSSDLMEICSDFAREEEIKTKDASGKEVKTKVARHGIGLVRAAGTPGADPAASHLMKDVSHVYGETPPLNQWVTLTIVGERGRTTLYVNGKSAGSYNDQMVCPLAQLGSKTGNSFVGQIRKLKIWNRNLSPTELAGLNK